MEKAYDRAQALADVSAVRATFDVAAVGRGESGRRPFADFEDGVVHEAALSARCDGIVTRNGAAFAGAALTVYTPGDLLAALASGGGDPT